MYTLRNLDNIEKNIYAVAYTGFEKTVNRRTTIVCTNTGLCVLITKVHNTSGD